MDRPMILCFALFCAVASAEQPLLDLKNTIQLVREQLNTMIHHRQQDYNALEENLKGAMEKNTELIMLKNEVRQLRKEVNALRGGVGNEGGNEAKNERLKVKWLGSAVNELRAEVAEVLRARNASEEFAQRSRMRSELDLLRGDVSEVGRGIRDLGGRLAKIEASLGTIRLDIFAVKERAGQLTRICADATSQVGTVQIEMKSLKCAKVTSPESNGVSGEENAIHIGHTRHGTRLISSSVLDKRLAGLERKISLVARKRGILEKRVVYENQDELKSKIQEIAKSQGSLESKLRNMSERADERSQRVDDSIIRLFESLEVVEEKIGNERDGDREKIAEMQVNAAKKYAELSLTREELANLRRTVQALGVSASRLQERSDLERERNEKRKKSLSADRKQIERARELSSMMESLPVNCEDREGATMLAAPGGGGQPIFASCHRGRIVIGRRIDGSVDFDRTWNEYAEGFGSPMSELWLGNEAIHRLTRDNCTRLAIDMVDLRGNHWRAEYENFRIESEETGYKLWVSGFSGNATDAFSYQNGMAFSAKDRDMDTSSADCAANYRGGWWFSHCQHANLNGRYSLGLAWYRSDINQWMAVASSIMSVQHRC